MEIKRHHIPEGYAVKKWGHIGNHEMWWFSASQAYLERRILLKYNRNAKPDTWLVYHDINKDCGYTILEVL